jgi:TolB-like protein/Flp pilus assembly protein TadD
LDTLIGRTVSHYLIEREIGRGGMGVVYLARDTRLRRAAAIKALPEGVAEDGDRLARFEQEARVLASLNHPNIAAIYGLEEAGGRRYLALEYVDGDTLAERIAHGPLPIGECIDVCLQIAAGIEAAHECGVIHRDLKPANVMLAHDDVVKILDFGLAKTLPATDTRPGSADTPTRAGSPATLSGLILGTTAYLSPEQARGKPVDRRTDIWSFGCTLHECLAGRPPFHAETPAEAIAKILERDPDWSALPAGTPPGLVHLLHRCLEKDPKHRLRDMGDARLALEEARAGRGKAAAPAVAPTPSIAVLPFVNMSRDEENEYFADGLSEELMNVLANVRGLRVVSRTSAFHFKGKDVDLGTVASKLNVAMVLEGSVRRSGNRLRTTAQLIDVATDSHLWSQTYDRTMDDLFAVQDEIAHSVVREIRAALACGREPAATTAAVRDEVSAAARGRGAQGEAYRLYLQGRFFEGRRTPDSIAKGIEYYRQAVEADPRYALAWAALAGIRDYQVGQGWVPFADGAAGAREAAERALRLEPDLPEGNATLGLIRLSCDWDWEGAETSIRRALELAPGNAEVVRTAGELASDLGRPEEAVDLGRRAVALDPLSVPARRSLAMFWYTAGLLDGAEAEINAALEIAPQQWQAHSFLCRIRLEQGRLDEALEECGREPGEGWRLFGLALAHHTRGQGADSDRALRDLAAKYAEPMAWQLAAACAWRGEADAAFTWLDRALQLRDRGLRHTMTSPLLRSLRGDARWPAFLGRLGLAA